jgi:hypothetical protein
MRKFSSGNDLAKEIGCSPEVLKKTCQLNPSNSQKLYGIADHPVDDHNKYAKNPGSDPFGKKVSNWLRQQTEC